MKPLPVIKYFHVFKNGGPRFVTRPKMPFIKPLVLHLSPESLHRCIVPTVAFAGHAANKTIPFNEFLVIMRTALGCRGRNELLLRWDGRASIGIFQGGNDQLLGHSFSYRQPDHLLTA